jgi:hypothetical protein
VKSEHIPDAVRKPKLTPEILAASIQDPCFYVDEVLGQRLHSFQPDFLRAIRDFDETAVRSGNGVAKSYAVGLAVNWALDCGTARSADGVEECKVLVTAPTFRQVQDTYRNFKHQREGAKYDLPGVCMEQPFCRIATKHYAHFFTAKDAAGFAGPHAARMFAFVDEAGGAPEDIYTGVYGCAVGEDDRIVHTGNPWSAAGTFAGLFKTSRSTMGKKLKLFTISALDSPNVKAGRQVVPGLVSLKAVERLVTRFGKNSDIYRVRVLGLPPRADSASVVPLAAWENAKIRGSKFYDPDAADQGVHPRVGRLRAGLDPGDGGDPSAFVVRDDVRVREVRTWNDRLPVTKELARIWLIENPQGCLALDATGLGVQMAHELSDEFGGRIVGVQFGSGQVSEDEMDFIVPSGARGEPVPLYANRRAEIWHKGGRWLDAVGEIEPTIATDLLQELEEEVLAPRWDTKGRRREKGQLLVEPKDETKKRIGRSPNIGDALMLAVAADYEETCEIAGSATVRSFRRVGDVSTARGGPSHATAGRTAETWRRY